VGRRGPAGALLLLLATGSAQGGALDQARDQRLGLVLPAHTWKTTGETLGPAPTAAQHAQALRQDPEHGTSFTVLSTHGPDDATRVLFLVPQFHRSPVVPLLWSSLGEAVAGIQENVDMVVTRLVLAHGVRCVGTEGSWADRLDRSDELDQVAGWAADLRAALEGARKVLTGDEATLAARLPDAADLLEPYLKRHALTLDGVGSALWRLRGHGVSRFGTEDERLNRRSMSLLQRMRPLEEELALLEPEEQSAGEDALGGIFLSEYGKFRDDVALPLQETLAQLDRARLDRMREGDTQEAAALARWGALAKRVVEEVLRLDEVERTHAYYAEVAERARQPAVSAESKPAKRLTRAQRQRLREVKTRLSLLQGEYERVAGQEREKAAVKRVLGRLGAGPVATCVLVMGASHEAGLVRQVVAQGKGGVAVVVVQPYAEDPPAAE
jgi:hypothetical protein